MPPEYFGRRNDYIEVVVAIFLEEPVFDFFRRGPLGRRKNVEAFGIKFDVQVASVSHAVQDLLRYRGGQGTGKAYLVDNQNIFSGRNLRGSIRHANQQLKQKHQPYGQTLRPCFPS